MSHQKTIGIYGLWHLGSVYAACLAKLGNRVVCFDESEEYREKIKNGEAPLFETGLTEALSAGVRAGIITVAESAEDFKKCDIVWMAIDTPVSEVGSPILDSLYRGVDFVAPMLTEEKILVVSSQVPLGTGESMCAYIEKKYGLRILYAYQPENLRLGAALDAFLHPARVIIGTNYRAAEKVLREVFAPLSTDLQVTTVASAEMIKHALNAFLATSLSFIYDIGDLCEKYGADALAVSRALKSDPRIGAGAYLDVSVGYAGATLQRDLVVLSGLAEESELTVPVLSGVLEKNKNRWTRYWDEMSSELADPLHSVVAIWGIAYKVGTSTTRDSLSLSIARGIANAVQEIHVHDPHVPKEDILKEVSVSVETDPYKAAENASILLIMTPWEEYGAIDFVKLAGVMKSPRIVFDAKNAFWKYEEDMKKAGLFYKGVGRGHTKKIRE